MDPRQNNMMRRDETFKNIVTKTVFYYYFIDVNILFFKLLSWGAQNVFSDAAALQIAGKEN